MSKKISPPFNPVFSWYIKKRIHQIDLFRKYPCEVQEETLFSLISRAKPTEFGKKHGFESITKSQHKETRRAVLTISPHLFIREMLSRNLFDEEVEKFRELNVDGKYEIVQSLAIEDLF